MRTSLNGTHYAVNDADCRSVHIAPWPRCVFAAVCKGDFDHLLEGSEATRQWLSYLHDVWPDGRSEQKWISSTVKVVDPSIDQRVVITSRGGRPTLQPLTPQQRCHQWERGTTKWLVLLHSQRWEREAAKSSRYRQLRDMGVELTPKLQRYLWCGPWEWCQLVWKLRANVSDLRYRASLWGTRVCDNDLPVGLRSSDRGVCPLCDRGKENTIHFLLYCSNDRIRHAWSEAWKTIYHDVARMEVMTRSPGQGRGSQIEDNASEAVGAALRLSEPPFAGAGGGTTCDVDEPREDDSTLWHAYASFYVIQARSSTVRSGTTRVRIVS